MFNPALLTPTPVRHEARFEQLDPDEPAPTTPIGPAHTQDHGLLKGELRVLTGLPPVLAQGLFSTPMAFPLLMKLSTLQDEALPGGKAVTQLAMALKVVGTEGARLPGSEGEVTQDFLLVNHPPCAASHGKTGLKKMLSAMTPGAARSESAQACVHILGETFHTASPMLHGPFMARLSVVPISPGMLLLKQASLDHLREQADGLRVAVSDFFATHSAEWELRIQLCTDVQTMPIEDDTVPWSEEQSPPLPIARITVPPQAAWSAVRAAAAARCMFSPWHGLAAHRPLGAHMRALQHRTAQAVAQEPRSLDDLPD